MDRGTETKLTLEWHPTDIIRAIICPNTSHFADSKRKHKQLSILLAANSVQGYQSVHNLERTFHRLCDGLGIPRISPHKLMHFSAIYALRGGAKLEVVSKILGHSSVAITVDFCPNLTYYQA